MESSSSHSPEHNTQYEKSPAKIITFHSFAQAIEAARRYVVNRLTGKPLFVTIEPTWKCDADCDFCQYRRSNKGLEHPPELSSYLPILRFLQPICLSFAGGETLLRPDLENLINEAKRARIPFIQITTNGSTLSVERYQSLSKNGMDRLNISMEFIDERHSQMRGIRDLHKRIHEFLKAVRSVRGAKIGLNVIFMKDNIENLETLFAFAEEHDVDVNLLPYTSPPVGQHAHQLENEQLQAVQIIHSLRDKYEHLLGNTPTYYDKLEQWLTGKNADPCMAGNAFLWVLPDGRLRACNRLTQPVGQSDPHNSMEFISALHQVRSNEEVKTCQACYLSCRGEAELAANIPRSMKHFRELIGRALKRRY